MPIVNMTSSGSLRPAGSAPARLRLEEEVRLRPSLRAALVRLWRTPGLNYFFRKGIPYVPASLRERIESERAIVRAAELQDEIANRPRLVSERRLRPLLARLPALVASVSRVHV